MTGKGYRLAAPLPLLNESRLKQSLGDSDVSLFTSIDSTNQWILDRIGQVQEGHLCFTEYQTAGKGRRGRTWVSPVGANLMFSLYWQMPDGMAAAMGVSLVVGVAVVETLHQFGLTDIRLKWPNDLYANDKKIAGILVEMTGQAGELHTLLSVLGSIYIFQIRFELKINQPLTDLTEVAGWIRL